MGVACLAAVACSSGSSTTVSSGGGGSTTTAGSPTPSVDPLAALTADQVFTKAVADAKAAPSLKMVGTVNESGAVYTVNLGFKKGEGCTGTIAVSGKGSFALTVIGTTAYLNPDAKFWKSYAGSSAATVIALLNGRYIKGSTNDANVAPLAKLCDINQLLGSFKPEGTISKGKVTTRGGQQLLPLKDSKGGTMFVTDTSTPQMVLVENLGANAGSSGTVTFAVNAPVTLVPPPASKVIDGSKLGF
jgi:hypothetical protein